MKGTSKRDVNNHTEDKLIMNKLESDEKSKSENLMIVDLIRNDFGRICEIGEYSVINSTSR